MDVEKEDINDLNIQVYDEKHRECKITSINVDKPDCKEFTTEFSEPIVKGDAGKSYTLVYDVEEPERYFENAFLIDCQHFELSFKYPIGNGIKRPELYEISQESETKTKSSLVPTIDQKDNFEMIKWEMDNLLKGKTMRIEW